MENDSQNSQAPENKTILKKTTRIITQTAEFNKQKPLLKILNILLVVFFLGITGFFVYQKYQLMNKKPVISKKYYSNRPKIKPTSKIDNRLFVTKITNDDIYQYEVKNNNKYVIWTDLGNNAVVSCKKGDLAHQLCLSQLYLYDIKKKKIKKISDSNYWIYDFKLFENTATWTNITNQVNNDNFVSITFYDIVSGKTEDITDKKWELISDNEASFQKESHTGPAGNLTVNSVYKIDLTKYKETRLLNFSRLSADTYGKLQGYKISGDYIYYEVDYNAGGVPSTLLYGKKINDKDGVEISRLYGLTGGDVSYTVSKNLISWLEFSSKDDALKRISANMTLYLYNFDTKVKTLVAILKYSHMTSPKIVDNYLIYYDESEQNTKIYDIDNRATLNLPDKLFYTEIFENESDFVEKNNQEISYFSIQRGGDIFLIRIYPKKF